MTLCISGIEPLTPAAATSSCNASRAICQLSALAFDAQIDKDILLKKCVLVSFALLEQPRNPPVEHVAGAALTRLARNSLVYGFISTREGYLLSTCSNEE